MHIFMNINTYASILVIFNFFCLQYCDQIFCRVSVFDELLRFRSQISPKTCLYKMYV